MGLNSRGAELFYAWAEQTVFHAIASNSELTSGHDLIDAQLDGFIKQAEDAVAEIILRCIGNRKMLLVGDRATISRAIIRKAAEISGFCKPEEF